MHKTKTCNSPFWCVVSAYLQYAYYKKMTHAAVLIQNQFRSYSAQKRKKNPGGSTQGSRRELERLKKGRNQSVIIQQRFRSEFFSRVQSSLVMPAKAEARLPGQSPLSSPGFGDSLTASAACGHVWHQRPLCAGQCWRGVSRLIFDPWSVILGWNKVHQNISKTHKRLNRTHFN